MASKKFELTTAQALAIAIEYMDGAQDANAVAARNRLAHDLSVKQAAAERKANAPRVPSKTGEENARLLREVLAILPTIGETEDGKPTGGYHLAAITSKVKGIMTASKLGVVIRPAVTDGTVVKYRGRLNGKTVTFYALAK